MSNKRIIIFYLLVTTLSALSFHFDIFCSHLLATLFIPMNITSGFLDHLINQWIGWTIDILNIIFLILYIFFFQNTAICHAAIENMKAYERFYMLLLLLLVTGLFFFLYKCSSTNKISHNDGNSQDTTRP